MDLICGLYRNYHIRLQVTKLKFVVLKQVGYINISVSFKTQNLLQTNKVIGFFFNENEKKINETRNYNLCRPKCSHR